MCLSLETQKDLKVNAKDLQIQFRPCFRQSRHCYGAPCTYTRRSWRRVCVLTYVRMHNDLEPTHQMHFTTKVSRRPEGLSFLFLYTAAEW